MIFKFCDTNVNILTYVPLSMQTSKMELMDNYIRFHLNNPFADLAIIKKNLILSVNYSIERIIK